MKPSEEIAELQDKVDQRVEAMDLDWEDVGALITRMAAHERWLDAHCQHCAKLPDPPPDAEAERLVNDLGSAYYDYARASYCDLQIRGETAHRSSLARTALLTYIARLKAIALGLSVKPVSAASEAEAFDEAADSLSR